jgi:hypothetical protein
MSMNKLILFALFCNLISVMTPISITTQHMSC